jgi:hypothetical protein
MGRENIASATSWLSRTSTVFQLSVEMYTYPNPKYPKANQPKALTKEVDYIEEIFDILNKTIITQETPHCYMLSAWHTYLCS